MAAQQRRLLTATNSQLGKVDLIEVLQMENAWVGLDQDTQRRLYALLPEQDDAQPDASINPLWTNYAKHLEQHLRRWQEDLREGRESKQWREEAIAAGLDRVRGKFADWTQLKREEWWGDDEQSDPVDEHAPSHVGADEIERYEVANDSDAAMPSATHKAADTKEDTQHISETAQARDEPKVDEVVQEKLEKQAEQSLGRSDDNIA